MFFYNTMYNNILHNFKLLHTIDVHEFSCVMLSLFYNYKKPHIYQYNIYLLENVLFVNQRIDLKDIKDKHLKLYDQEIQILN